MRQDISSYEEKPLRTAGLLQAAHQYSLQDMSGSTNTSATLCSLLRSDSSKNLITKAPKTQTLVSFHVHLLPETPFLGEMLRLTCEVALCTASLFLEPFACVFVFTLDCNKRTYCYDTEDACFQQPPG